MKLLPSGTCLTVRAAATGMGIGSLLSLCNVYAGLKVGWSANMAVASLLIGFSLWRGLGRFGATRFGMMENTASQAAASTAALASSAGLAAPIPALALLTGRNLGWPWLPLWLASVMAFGVIAGALLRRPLLEAAQLPFPYGVAAAQALRELHRQDELPRQDERLDTMSARARALLAGAAFAAVVALVRKPLRLRSWSPPLSLPIGAARASLRNLTIALNANLLLCGIGGLVGMRVGASMLLGALLAWGLCGPVALAHGWALAGKPDPAASWFEPMIGWLLWPGVGLLVASTLTSFALSLPALWRSLRTAREPATPGQSHAIALPANRARAFDPRLVAALSALAAVNVACQRWLFGISLGVASVAAAMALGLALVGARAAGETGVTPGGPLGKVAQLALSLLAPANPTANLMGANVSSGTAALASDALSGYRVAESVGAQPRALLGAQLCGVLAGAVSASAAYRLLLPDPRAVLVTDAWPAPAALQWKAVADLLQHGVSALPPGALAALGWASAFGAALAALERWLPAQARRRLPSAAAMGLAFVIPASYSLAAFVGAAAAWLLSRKGRGELVMPISSGLIVGESVAGALYAIATVSH